MNVLEAGVVPSVPIGAIAGGFLCRAWGAAGIIGGAAGGAVVGGLAGWLYALFVLLVTVVFGVVWNAGRGWELKPPEYRSVECRRLFRIQSAGVSTGVVLGASIGFLCGWFPGLLYALLQGIIVAVCAVAAMSSRMRKPDDPVT